MMKSLLIQKWMYGKPLFQALGMPLEVNVAAELQNSMTLHIRAPLYIVISMRMMEPLQNHKNLFF